MKLLLKTLLATALLTVGLSASAQIIDQLPLDDNVAENHSKTVSADNGHLWIDGKKLSDNEALAVLGEETYSIYSKARRQIRIGETTATIGGTLLGAGIGYGLGGLFTSKMLGNKEDARDYLIKGGIMAIIGSIPLAIGLPVMKKGNKKLESIAGSCHNGQRTGELSLGNTGSGFGICYRF